jgi:hypothetical protein
MNELITVKGSGHNVVPTRVHSANTDSALVDRCRIWYEVHEVLSSRIRPPNEALATSLQWAYDLLGERVPTIAEANACMLYPDVQAHEHFPQAGIFLTAMYGLSNAALVNFDIDLPTLQLVGMRSHTSDERNIVIVNSGRAGEDFGYDSNCTLVNNGRITEVSHAHGLIINNGEIDSIRGGGATVINNGKIGSVSFFEGTRFIHLGDKELVVMTKTQPRIGYEFYGNIRRQDDPASLLFGQPLREKYAGDRLSGALRSYAQELADIAANDPEKLVDMRLVDCGTSAWERISKLGDRR